jgi:hypothetical protein
VKLNELDETLIERIMNVNFYGTLIGCSSYRKTTQIYAKMVDEKKEKAAHAIKLNINN